MFHNHTLLDATRAPKVTAAGFVGLGDIVSGALYYSGMRSYSSTTILANAVLVQRFDGSQTPIATAPSGAINDAAADAYSAADTITPGAPLKIVAVYDQIGTCHISLAAGDYTKLAINGKSGIVLGTNFSTAGSGTVGPTRAQAFSLIMVIRHNTFTTAQQFFGNDGGPHFGYPAANQAGLYSGTATGLVSGVSDDVYHSIQAVYNGSSSVVSIDGAALVPVSPNPGASGLSGNFYIGNDAGGGQLFKGGFGEFAIYPGDVVTPNRAAIYNNQNIFFGV